MATIQPADIPDVVVTTRVSEGRLRFQQIAQNLPFYEIFSRWFKRDKVMFSSGYKIQRTLMNKLNRAAAKHVGFLQPDAVNIMDVLTTMSVEWVHAQTDWGIVYQTDVLMNSGKDLILNIIKPRRLASLLGLVEEIEELGFGTAPGEDDNVNPWALKYWNVWNATDGFTGGAPSGHTTKGGVNPSSVPHFKNYAITYAAVSDNDLVKKLRTMFRKCRFVSPISHPDYRARFGIATVCTATRKRFPRSRTWFAATTRITAKTWRCWMVQPISRAIPSSTSRNSTTIRRPTRSMPWIIRRSTRCA